jgi:hypothetical protein
LIAVAGSPDDAFPAFVRRLATRNSPQLLGLLKRRLRNLSPPQCVALAKALPVFGELFTQGEHVKDDPGAKEFADFLAWLIHQAYPASRYEPANAAQRHILAAETTEKIEPLALASTFINALYDVTRSIKWNYHGNNYRREEEDDWLRVIAPEGWPVVLAPIARRLRECAERDPTAMVPKDNTGDTDLLDLWRRADPEGRREWLEAHLRQCPADGVNVLRYLGFSSYPVDEKYRDVAREISPAAIKDALLRHFGSSLTADEANSSDLSLARYYLDEFENQTKTVSSGAESIE